MNNFCVDEISVEGTVVQRSWFRTRDEAMRAADKRDLNTFPVDPKSRLRVYALAPIHERV